MSDAAELAFLRRTQAVPTNLRPCAWDRIDGPLWLLVMRERDGSLGWSWQVMDANRKRIPQLGTYGLSATWADFDRDSERGRVKAWAKLRERIIMESANVDCRSVR